MFVQVENSRAVLLHRGTSSRSGWTSTPTTMLIRCVCVCVCVFACICVCVCVCLCVNQDHQINGHFICSPHLIRSCISVPSCRPQVSASLRKPKALSGNGQQHQSNPRTRNGQVMVRITTLIPMMTTKLGNLSRRYDNLSQYSAPTLHCLVFQLFTFASIWKSLVSWLRLVRMLLNSFTSRLFCPQFLFFLLFPEKEERAQEEEKTKKGLLCVVCENVFFGDTLSLKSFWNLFNYQMSGNARIVFSLSLSLSFSLALSSLSYCTTQKKKKTYRKTKGNAKEELPAQDKNSLSLSLS